MSEMVEGEVAAIRERLMSIWADSREQTRAMLQDIPADLLYLQPAGRAASIGQILHHMARGVTGLVNRLAGREWDAGNEVAKDASLAELVAAYSANYEAAVNRLAEYSDADWQSPLGTDGRGNPRTLEQTLQLLTIHDNYHRGQIWYVRQLLDIPGDYPVPPKHYAPSAASLEAQAALRSYLMNIWEQVHEWTQEAVRDLTDEQLALRPLERAASIGQIVHHITDSQVRWTNLARTGDYEGVDISADAPKETLIRRHEYTQRECQSQMYALDIALWRDPFPSAHHNGRLFTPEWIICHLLEHEIYHDAQINYAAQVLGFSEPSFVAQ